MKNLKMTMIPCVLLMIVISAVIITGCGKSKSEANQTVENAETADEYPQIAYINNVSYYGTGEVCQMVPRKAPDGMIETFVPAEIMPDAPNSANFGAEQGSMEYMFTEDDRLIIHVGENWYYFNIGE